jgi:tRNA dimethylallyltransferase
MKNKPKIIVILGPTASGKSDLAVLLAKKFGGEVVSADSRQVYKGLDIGSGKITKKEMKGVPHHMLDVVNPKKTYSVHDFQKDAIKEIDKILQKGKVPIVCGGTGFYIDSIVKGTILPEVKPDLESRIMNQELSKEKLFEKLKKLDPKRAKEIDPNNKVRLIRAIEIATALGKVPKIKTNPKYDALQIGVLFDTEILRERINLRLQKRLKIGMIKEVENLHKNGLSWKRLEELGLEYRYIALYLQKKLTKEQMVTELQNKIYQYAKRQITWFKRDKNIVWVEKPEITKIEKLVGKFLENHIY